MKISVSDYIVPDKKGYFDRECPNPDCGYRFKVKLSDWKNKVSDERVYCPRCGHIDNSDQWWTQDQVKEVERLAVELIENDIAHRLEKSFCRLNTSIRSNSPIGFQFSIKRTPRLPFYFYLIRQCKEWEKEIVCEKCGTQYSITGSAFFCPCCGYNSVEKTFSDSMQRIISMFDSFSSITASLGRDEADDLRRLFIERSLTDIVSAFQIFASNRYKVLTGVNPRRNDFQNIENGSSKFESISGKGYSAWLSPTELSFIKILFQRRHCLEHCGGIVDQQYIERSGDHSYQKGQRLVVKEHDIRDLISIIQKLANGLNQIKCDMEDSHDEPGHRKTI